MGASDTINLVPGIESKRYLELGVANGATFNKVLAQDKTSVDCEYPATFQMKTDEFFAQATEKWDVIFIDADHTFAQVVRDYNGAVKCLSEGGLVFMHDLVPPSKEYALPWHCGDAFKFLFWLMVRKERRPRFYVAAFNFGLTLFIDPVPVTPAPECSGVSYDAFRVLLDTQRLYGPDGFAAVLATQP